MNTIKLKHQSSNWPIYASAMVAVAGLATMATLTIIAIRGPGLSSMNHINLGLSIGGCYLFILFTLTSVFLYRDKQRNEKMAAAKKEHDAAIKIQRMFRSTYDRNTLIAKNKPSLCIHQIKKEDQTQVKEVQDVLESWRNKAQEKLDRETPFLTEAEKRKLEDCKHVCDRIIKILDETDSLNRIDISRDQKGKIQSVAVSRKHRGDDFSWYIPYIVSNPEKSVRGSAAVLIVHTIFLSLRIKRRDIPECLSRIEKEQQRTRVKVFSLKSADEYYLHLGFIRDPKGMPDDMVLEGSGLRKCLRKYGGIATIAV